MKRKFEILQHQELKQIQMWLNQKQTVKGNVKVETDFTFLNGQYIILISFDDQ